MGTRRVRREPALQARSCAGRTKKKAEYAANKKAKIEALNIAIRKRLLIARSDPYKDKEDDLPNVELLTDLDTALSAFFKLEAAKDWPHLLVNPMRYGTMF